MPKQTLLKPPVVILFSIFTVTTVLSTVAGCQTDKPSAASSPTEVVGFKGGDPSPEEIARRKVAQEAAMKNGPGQSEGPSTSMAEARQKYEGAKKP